MTDILRSEWTKIRSVRSTVWTLAATALLMLALGTLITIAAIQSADGPVPPGNAAVVAMSGTSFASLAIATFGVLVISSEYRTGAIRVSLLAVPKRLRLLAAKIVVFTALTLVVTTASVFATLLAAQILHGQNLLGAPGVLRTAFGTALYLTACGLFGLALGALVRHTPGAIVSAIGLILVLPQLTTILPGEWGKTVSDYFTSNAGMQIAVPSPHNPLGPWAGFGVYLGWIAITMIGAAILLDRRDA
jgi:ABC-2 type transport system permease protein